MWESEAAKNKYCESIMKPLGYNEVIYKKNLIHSSARIDLCHKPVPKPCAFDDCTDFAASLFLKVFPEV